MTYELVQQVHVPQYMRWNLKTWCRRKEYVQSMEQEYPGEQEDQRIKKHRQAWCAFNGE